MRAKYTKMQRVGLRGFSTDLQCVMVQFWMFVKVVYFAHIEKFKEMNSTQNLVKAASVAICIALISIFSYSANANVTTTVRVNEIIITGLEKTTEVVIYGDAWSTKDVLWAGTLKKWQKKQFEITSHQTILIKSGSAVQVSHPQGFTIKSAHSIISSADFTVIDMENCIRLNISTSPEKTVPHKDYMARLSGSELSNGVKETRNIETVRNDADNEYYIVGDFYDFHDASYIYLLQGFQDLNAGGNVAFSGTALSASECLDCEPCKSIDRAAWMETIMEIIGTWEEVE
jgi:hypothetical protein